MTLLKIKLGNKQDLEWAQSTVEKHHYLHHKVDNRARPMVYVIHLFDEAIRVGLIMAGIPHATRCKGWWGYEGLPTQWQTLDLCRIWIDPRCQIGGEYAKPGYVPGFTDRKGIFRPTVATWAIHQVLDRVQVDRVSLWPPVYINQPYHIRLVISYHDPKFHQGKIYRLTNAKPMYTRAKEIIPGSSGKYGWCWELPQPSWVWDQIKIQQPRTMRLALEGL